MCNRVVQLLVGLMFFCLVAWHPRNAKAQSEFPPGEPFVEEVVLRDLPISTAIAFA
jgi:hypothetical protein